MGRDDGNGFVRCSLGHRHWGRHGAAGLLLTDPERGILLQRRSWWVHHGGKWALPGGAVETGELPGEAAVREAREEAEVPPEAVRTTSASTVDHGNWRYTTVLGTVRRPVEARIGNSESAEIRWVPPGEVADFPLHKDFELAWPQLSEQVDRELVLVVDAANVVGSRPDGWWRDRAGAATRLRDKLASLAATGVSDDALPNGATWSWWPRVVLVVEGKARGVGSIDGAEVVSADTDGDSAIVAETKAAIAQRPRDHIVVVTADRALRAQVEAAGATTLGPSALLAHLDGLP